ncbi:MAG: 1-(5-phosphoribosyl)-5-[(5-phosphoribosylamino)methylideneamino] imidazole-4-carboxamide isomerase [Ignavibacteria bacterium]|nr:1-(5-phosphoribosyl)-5-[(5-phosphoribosylamino)methylideneamino] imidazole-4-carboxamide isomerase [Ignavibacteria bacterium]
MLIIPVIDIKNERCVRIIEGHGEKTMYYSERPLQVAKLFRKENFKALHITDLDAAVYGDTKNHNLIREITKSIDIPVQLAGGIKSYEIAEYCFRELGVYRVIVGTTALTNPEMIRNIIKDFSNTKIVIGIDEKLNNVVTNGWIEYANITPLDFSKYMETLGVKRIIYQDVTRVGNLCGPFVDRVREIALNTNLKITVAGGVSDYRDLKVLKDLNIPNVDSVMIGRALYENKFPCQKMWRDIESIDISLELPEV